MVFFCMQNVEDYVASHPPLLSPGIDKLMSELQSHGKDVYLVSGGFRQVRRVAELSDGFFFIFDHVSYTFVEWISGQVPCESILYAS